MAKISLLMLVAVFMTGCFESRPMIDGYHWNGGELYDSMGNEIAIVIVFPFATLASKACIFDKKIDPGPCTEWETGQEAYDYVGRKFREAGADIRKVQP